MNWRRSATGNWVAYDGKNRYAITALACFKGNKPCRRYRIRINESAVGGETPQLFMSLVGAMKFADSLVSK